MLAYFKVVGPGLVFLHPFGAVDPGFGVPGFGPVDPGFGVGLPPHVGGGPARPPHFPDHSLPPGPPPHVPNGTVVVLVRDPAGVWHYATMPEAAAPKPIPMPPTPAPKG